MAGSIKGITIEFRGDTTKLSKALKDVRKEAGSLDKELGYIDNSLKFNPGNVELVAQKMTVLKQAADKAGDNAEDLKKALADMKANGVDETSEEYRELEREIIRAESKQKAYNKELAKLKAENSALGKLSKKFEDFGSKATAAGEALAPLSKAAAAVDVAIGALAVSSGKAADDLVTLSNQTGVSTSDLQKYKAAADLLDVSVETMANSQVTLKKRMYQASQGSKKQVKAFEELGVSVTDSNGELRDQSEVFDEVIKALGSMKNETERDAIAMQIFGGDAKELNSLIKDGGETYQKVADIFAKNDLSIVDEETLQGANKFNDALDTIKLTAQAALSKVGSQLAAYLAPAMEKVAEKIGEIMGWLSKLDPKVVAIIGVIAGVVAGLAPLLIIIGKVSTGISSIMMLGAKIGPLLAGLAGPVGIAVAVIGGLIAVGVLLYKNWDTIKTKVTSFVAHVKAKWIMLKRDITTTVNAIKEKIYTVWTNIKTKVTTLVTNLVTSVKNAWTNLKTAITEKVNAIKEAIVTKWNSIKDSVKAKVDSIKESIKTKFESIKNTIKEKVEAAKTAVKEKFENIKTSVKEKVENLKNSIKEKFENIKTSIKEKIESMKESVKAKIDAMKESVKAKVDAMKESIKSKFDSLKESVKSKIEALKNSVKAKFDAIKEKMLSPIESAKEKIKSAIDTIKNIINNAKLKLPHFKLPHFKIDGGELPWGIGGKGKKPSISVEWYKEGGIFNKPSLIGVGEAGAEAVLPIEKLKDWMQQTSGGITINVYASEGMNVNELAIEIERRLTQMQRRRSGAWA